MDPDRDLDRDPDPEPQTVRVRFLPDDKPAVVEPGTTPLAASERAGVDIITGCTQGMCGTDPVRITEGADGLAPPGDPERGTLERMGLPGDYRLSCSAKVLRGSITVVLGTF